MRAAPARVGDDADPWPTVAPNDPGFQHVGGDGIDRVLADTVPVVYREVDECVVHDRTRVPDSPGFPDEPSEDVPITGDRRRLVEPENDGPLIAFEDCTRRSR
jgi:hypothetical protein